MSRLSQALLWTGLIGSLLCTSEPVGAQIGPGLRRAVHQPPGPLLSQRWEDLSPQQRRRALRNFRRFQRLSPEQRRTLKQRYRRWRSMPPRERERILRNYERYMRMDPYEKEEFEELYRRWKSHPRRPPQR